MPRRDVERLADAIWRAFRPSVLNLLDTALAVQEDGESSDEISAEDEARLDAWVARRRKSEQERGPCQGKRGPSTSRRRKTS